MSIPSSWLIPDWPAPANVRALSTSREGGVSRGPFAAFNTGDRVADEPQAVAQNRAQLRALLELPAEPAWLWQVHGIIVVDAAEVEGRTEADASYAANPAAVCAVTTADCLAVLLCDLDGQRVGAAHAGWRGLAAGVLEATVDALATPPQRLLAWLGPAIGPQAFEVADEVRTRFVEHNPGDASAFTPSPSGRWLADIYRLARSRLESKGVTRIYGGGLCTYSDPQRFYSFRRDGMTGRMASLIWLK